MEAHAAVTVLDRFVVIIGKLLYYFSCRTMTVNYRLSVNYDKKQSKLITMKENDDSDDDDDKKDKKEDDDDDVDDDDDDDKKEEEDDGDDDDDDDDDEEEKEQGDTGRYYLFCISP